MKAKIESLENELSILDWYFQVLEKGIDTKKMLRESAQLQNKVKDLK